MIPAPAADFGVLAPVVVLVCAGLLVLLVDLLARNASRALLYGLGIAGCVAAFAALARQFGHPASTLAGAFSSDRFSWAFDSVILFALVVTLLLSVLKNADDGASPGSYAALLLFCAVGGMILAGATNLIVIFLGVEQLSLALYILAGTGVGRPASQESALKYVLLGSFASGFLIYGSALLYGASGGIALADVARAAAAPSLLFWFGFALFLVGIGFKLSLAPFHVWTPDVYEGAPLAVTAFMSVAVKAAAFSALARVAFTVFKPDSPALYLLWTIAILSMIVGNVGALRQTNLKRLLAYSSIAQAGYMVVALSGLSDAGLASLVFYLMAYGFMNLGAFALIALVGEGRESAARLEEYRGMFWRRPWVASLLTLCMFSLAGIPATAGFIGKVLLIGQGIGGGPWGVAMALALVTGTIVSFYVYLKVVTAMFDRTAPAAGAVERVAAPVWVAVAAGCIGVVVLGVAPQLFYDSAAYLLGR